MGYGKVGVSKERMCSYKHTHNSAVHTIVITQITLSIDELSGGIDKILNPKDTYNGKESKPLKYLVGKYLGKGGDFVYNVIDIGTGTIDIAKSEKLIDIVGVYDTVSDAQDAANSISNKEKQEESTSTTVESE